MKHRISTQHSQRAAHGTSRIGGLILAAGTCLLLANGAFAAPTPQLSPAQLHDFASAAKELQGLNNQVHQEAMNPKLTPAQKEKLKNEYMAKTNAILAQHHLTAQRYTELLQETRRDPAFAKEVEGAMH
ncbi:DUF4168 domain-containing protein [Acidithiobacillus caldus]